MSVDEIILGIHGLRFSIGKLTEETMDSNTVQTMPSTAVKQATDQVRQNFEGKIDDLTQRLATLETPLRVEE